jgi:hypothetical protein
VCVNGSSIFFFLLNLVLFQVISYLVNLILLVSVVTDRMIVKRGILWTRIFFFPCVWTGLWYLFSRFGGLGDYTAFSTPLADWADLAQISSLGGRPLIDFLVSLFGTVMLETISGTPESDPLLEPDDNTEEENNENSDDDGKFAQNRSLWNQPLAWYGVLLALVFVYGGAQTNIHSGSFYQNSLTEYVPPSLPVGCVVGPGQNVVLAKNHSHWLELTENLAEVRCDVFVVPKKKGPTKTFPSFFYKHST